MTEQKIQKPFLKWVGGKTQIIKDIISKIPKEINNYHELFLGGGSVLLAILSLQKENTIVIKNKIYAYDINNVLINVYKHIQNNNNEIYKYINQYITEYNSIQILSETSKFIKESKTKPKDLSKIQMEEYSKLKIKIKHYRKSLSLDESKISKEHYYYWLRKKYNEIDKTTIECSALFIILNKTCFRGMYREGPNGFNFPFGNYKNLYNVTKEEFDIISKLIENVEFRHSSFETSIKNVKEDDLVYLDPPYAPINDDSFVGYVADGFNLETHKLLFSEIKKLGKIKFIMSNAKVDLVTDNFKEYKCHDIIARRAINSKKPGSTTTEVIIYNSL